VPALLPCCGLTTAQLPHTTLFLLRQAARDVANTAQGLAALLGWPPSLVSPPVSPAPSPEVTGGPTSDAAERAGVLPLSQKPSSRQVVGGGGWVEALGSNSDWRQAVTSITAALEVSVYVCVCMDVGGRGEEWQQAERGLCKRVASASICICTWYDMYACQR
jgi:hypothetical protein